MGVLMSAGKAARNQASIVNRTNTCGGNKRAGTAPRTGWFMQSNPTLRRAPQRVQEWAQKSFPGREGMVARSAPTQGDGLAPFAGGADADSGRLVQQLDTAGGFIDMLSAVAR